MNNLITHSILENAKQKNNFRAEININKIANEKGNMNK